MLKTFWEHYKFADQCLKKTAWGRWHEKHKKGILITAAVELIVLAVVLIVYFKITHKF